MLIVFMGNPDFSVPALRAICESRHKIAGVVCSPDKPRGRGRKVAPLPVKATAQEFDLPLFQPHSLKDPVFLAEIRELRPDAFVVVAFRILPRELFSIPRFGSLNIHPSLLPKGRGPAPIQWTLLNGETETGISIIQLTEEIDGGGLLAQERSAISDEECFGDLHDRFANRGAELIIDVLDRLDSGEAIEPIPQVGEVSKAPKLSVADAEINWSNPAQAVVNQIRAFSPAPGACAKLRGEPFKILRAKKNISMGGEPGKIHIIKNSMFVETKMSAVELLRVKPAGKGEMSADAYLRGCRDLPESFN
jgi:methionyl-tRNA formyltransferase